MRFFCVLDRLALAAGLCFMQAFKSFKVGFKEPKERDFGLEMLLWGLGKAVAQIPHAMSWPVLSLMYHHASI